MLHSYATDMAARVTPTIQIPPCAHAVAPPHHGFQNFLVQCLDALMDSLQLQFGCCFPTSFICFSLQDGPHVLNRAQLGATRGVLLLGHKGDTLPFQKLLGLPGIVA